MNKSCTLVKLSAAVLGRRNTERLAERKALIFSGQAKKQQILKLRISHFEQY